MMLGLKCSEAGGAAGLYHVELSYPSWATTMKKKKKEGEGSS